MLPALVSDQEELKVKVIEKAELPSLNPLKEPLLVNSKQVRGILKLREKRQKLLNKMGLELNQENYKLVTIPNRDKKKSGYVKTAAEKIRGMKVLYELGEEKMQTVKQ